MPPSYRPAVEDLPGSTAEPADDADGDDSGLDVRAVAGALVSGAIGGLLGTVTMTAYRLPLFEGLPPTAEFWATYVAGGDPADHPVPALALHAAYGTAAGSALGVALSRVGADASERDDRVALIAGVAYSLLLSAFGDRVLLRALLDVDLDGGESLVFHVGHVVYGLTLGTWLGTAGAIGRSRSGE